MTFFVYVVFDADRRCLYVGQTGNLRQRMRSHDSSSFWMPQAATIWTIKCESRADALQVEANRIRKLRPRYNRALTFSYKGTVEDFIDAPLSTIQRRRDALAALADTEVSA